MIYKKKKITSLRNHNSFADRMAHFYRGLDIFGKPISFTYKGESHYRTYFGATLSVIQVCLLLLFIGNELLELQNHNSHIRISTFQRDFIQDYEAVVLDNYDLDFAIKINSISQNQTLNQEWDRYASLSIVEIQKFMVSNNGSYRQQQQIRYLEVTKCDEKRFNIPFIKDFETTYDTYYCLRDQQLKLQGSLDSKIMVSYQINIAECNQTTLNKKGTQKSCATQSSEITNALKDLQIFTTFIGRYYDFSQTNQYSDTIKTFAKTHYSKINPYLSIINTASIKATNVRLTNSIISNQIEQQNYELYEAVLTQSYTGTPAGDKDPFVGYALSLDQEVKTIERENKTILQLLSNTGGIALVLTFILGWLSQKITDSQYPIDASNDIYSTYENKQVGILSKTITRSSMRDIETSISQYNSTHLKSEKNTANPVNFTLVEYVQLKFTQCLKWGKRKNEFQHRLDLYKEGIESFKKTTDTLSIIKMQRQIKWILKNLLNEPQKLTVKTYEKKFLGIKNLSRNKSQKLISKDQNTFDITGDNSMINSSYRHIKKLDLSQLHDTFGPDNGIFNLPLQDPSSDLSHQVNAMKANKSKTQKVIKKKKILKKPVQIIIENTSSDRQINS